MFCLVIIVNVNVTQLCAYILPLIV